MLERKKWLLRTLHSKLTFPRADFQIMVTSVNKYWELKAGESTEDDVNAAGINLLRRQIHDAVSKAVCNRFEWNKTHLGLFTTNLHGAHQQGSASFAVETEKLVSEPTQVSLKATLKTISNPSLTFNSACQMRRGHSYRIS